MLSPRASGKDKPEQYHSHRQRERPDPQRHAIRGGWRGIGRIAIRRQRGRDLRADDWREGRHRSRGVARHGRARRCR